MFLLKVNHASSGKNTNFYLFFWCSTEPKIKKFSTLLFIVLLSYRLCIGNCKTTTHNHTVFNRKHFSQVLFCFIWATTHNWVSIWYSTADNGMQHQPTHLREVTFLCDHGMDYRYTYWHIPSYGCAGTNFSFSSYCTKKCLLCICRIWWRVFDNLLKPSMKVTLMVFDPQIERNPLLKHKCQNLNVSSFLSLLYV